MTNETKTYAASWKGKLILACRKCQKKLKGHPDLYVLAKPKSGIKKHNKENPEHALHVLNVPCMGLCPKGGVTVCNPTETPSRLSILRGTEDIKKMFGKHRARR